MLVASVPPNEACKPPAPKGKKVSELEKKKRALILSRLSLNSRSQFVVNWSSVYFPGLLTAKRAVLTVAWQVSGFTVTPAPTPEAAEGIKKPFASLNKLFLGLNCNRFKTTESIVGSVTFGQPAGFFAVGGVAGLLKSLMSSCSNAAVLTGSPKVPRSVGIMGKPGLLICVPGERALRCRVPW